MAENMNNFERSTSAGQAAVEKLGALWCDLVHDSPMWPIHGEYECRTCGRHYAVPWAENRLLPVLQTTAAHVRSVRVPWASLPIIIVLSLALVVPGRASDAAIMDSTAGASLAFARYTAGLEEISPWRLETVEIEASLPKLEKTGRMRAIRRVLPFGKPEYQVLEITGDSTIRKQVIVRYLSAEVMASAIPASSVAITPANYRFRYKGAVQTSESVAYIFLITPRKKRTGLIKGELWLDGSTGAVVRQSGYLVKRPSIFVKRINVTRETTLRDGLAETRLTHLSVDTRLVGPAELTILERPFTGLSEAMGSNIEER
jgi:hypothetical protein